MEKLKLILKILIVLIIGFLLYINAENIVNDYNKIFNDNEYTYEVIITGNLINEDEVDQLEDSHVEYKTQEFDATMYPYYNMLNDNEKQLYNQIYANVIALEEIFKLESSITIDEAQRSIEALYNDHPELFWLNSDFTYKYTSDNICVQIELSYNNTIDNFEESKEIFDSKVNEILDVATTLSSNYEKERYVHDTLLANIEYDESSVNNQSVYSAIVNGYTVCAGYARAFQYLMSKLDIPTYYVTGVADNVNHAWNIIYLDDGYYNVDLTWDDTSNNAYSYFNKDDSYFGKTHVRTSMSINLPKCLGRYYLNE